MKRTALLLALTLFPSLCRGLAAPPTFPNVGYLGAGYDVMYGNPQSPGRVDPAFRSCVFNLTVYAGDLTPDQRYQVPVGTEVANCTACSLSFGSTQISSAYDYSQSLEVDVSGDLGGWGAKFSASVDYKSVTSGTSASTNTFTSASNCGTTSVLVGTQSWGFLGKGSQRKGTHRTELVGNSTLGIGASSVRRLGIDGSKVVLSSLHYIVVAINARPGHTPHRCCAGSPNDRCEREPETLKVCRTSFPLYSRRCNAVLNSAVQCQWK